MGSRYKPGDFVACYITNTKVIDELLEWGMVLEVSETLKDILVLDSRGGTNWWPAHRWTLLDHKQKSRTQILGTLA